MRTTRMWSCDSGGDPVRKPRTRALEPDDQEHLLRALLEELDGPADPDVERMWLADAGSGALAAPT